MANDRLSHSSRAKMTALILAEQRPKALHKILWIGISDGLNCENALLTDNPGQTEVHPLLMHLDAEPQIILEVCVDSVESALASVTRQSISLHWLTRSKLGRKLDPDEVL